jgi:hypothetical protein
MPQTQTSQGTRHPREEGQGVVEAIIALPAFLLLSTIALQIALLGVDQIVLQYATFCAARTGAVREGEPEDMKDAASRILRAVPGCRLTPGPDLTLELLPGPGPAKKSADPALPPEELPLRVRIAWRCPLIVPVAGPLLGGWRGEGSWLRPTFPLQSSWGIWMEKR